MENINYNDLVSKVNKENFICLDKFTFDFNIEESKIKTVNEFTDYSGGISIINIEGVNWCVKSSRKDWFLTHMNNILNNQTTNLAVEFIPIINNQTTNLTFEFMPMPIINCQINNCENGIYNVQFEKKYYSKYDKFVIKNENNEENQFIVLENSNNQLTKCKIDKQEFKIELNKTLETQYRSFLFQKKPGEHKNYIPN